MNGIRVERSTVPEGIMGLPSLPPAAKRSFILFFIIGFLLMFYSVVFFLDWIPSIYTLFAVATIGGIAAGFWGTTLVEEPIEYEHLAGTECLKLEVRSDRCSHHITDSLWPDYLMLFRCCQQCLILKNNIHFYRSVRSAPSDPTAFPSTSFTLYVDEEISKVLFMVVHGKPLNSLRPDAQKLVIENVKLAECVILNMPLTAVSFKEQGFLEEWPY